MDKGLPEVVERKLTPLEQYGARALLFALALSLVAAPFSYLLFEVLSDGPLTSFDEDAVQWLNGHVADHPLAVRLIGDVSNIGKPVTLYLIVGAAVIWLWAKGSRKLAVFLITTGLGGGLVDTLVKLAVGRPRPTVEHPVAHAFGKSFPSGHAMSSVVCYGALLLVFLPLLGPRARRAAIAGTVALVVAIGCARLALGVHYVSDVLGGAVLGLAWLAASVAAFEIWREDRGRRRTKPLDEGVEPEEA